VVRLVKNEFIPLAINGRLRDFDDDESRFLNKADCGGQGRVDVITASGKLVAHGELQVGNPKTHLASLERALKAWAALPEAERKPGAVKVPERGPLDPRRNTAKGPPAGTLIVRVYNRQLERTATGEYRHTVPEDYIPALRDPRVVGTDQATPLWTQPANDSLWITQAEARAMMPADPVPGQRVEVPTSLCERIFRFHLDPSRGLSENTNFAHVTADAGKLWLTVEEVGKTEVRLRLDGIANLHNPRSALLTYQSPGVKEHSQNPRIPLDYDPRLLGYLAYNPAKKVITRLDIVALGDVRGRPNGENIVGERLGEANPLGIAFELVTDPRPADYLPPRAARDEPSLRPGVNLVERYLGLPKKEQQR
jgi:hypothetical protein